MIGCSYILTVNTNYTYLVVRTLAVLVSLIAERDATDSNAVCSIIVHKFLLVHFILSNQNGKTTEVYFYAGLNFFLQQLREGQSRFGLVLH